MNASFLKFWLSYGDKPLGSRQRYFNSLTKCQQGYLIESFYDGGWDKFFVQVYIDYLLDQIKKEFDIDLIDLRIKAIKLNKVFLINRNIWERITALIFEWDNFYDTDVIFGGLLASTWGKEGQYCKIRARKHLQWR